MRIRIDDIPEDGLDVTLTGAEDILSEALARIPAGRRAKIDPYVKGRLQITSHEDDIFFVGRVNATMLLQCSRCLADFALDKELDLNLVIRRRDPEVSMENEERLDREVDSFLIGGDEIDPGEIIIQELFLEIPMKPLCSEECPGLCPGCGALKGSPECQCPREDHPDPRWEALARLKKDEAP